MDHPFVSSIIIIINIIIIPSKFSTPALADGLPCESVLGLF